MEEIKIGEYVRLKNGKIIKFFKFGTRRKNLSKEILFKTIITEKGHGSYRYDDIVAHSSNIIDLIKVGDYVNGKLVKHIADFEGVKEPIRKLIFVDEYRLVPGETARNDEIKSIVTKEQFELVQYKLDN